MITRLFPDAGGFAWFALVLSLTAFVGMQYGKWPMLPVIAGSAVAGYVWKAVIAPEVYRQAGTNMAYICVGTGNIVNYEITGYAWNGRALILIPKKERSGELAFLLSGGISGRTKNDER